MKMTVMVNDVFDGATFRVSSSGTVRMKDVAAPGLLIPESARDQARLDEPVLRKHVQCEESDSGMNGNVIARVWADGIGVNRALRGGVRTTTDTPRPAEPATRVEIQHDESSFTASANKEGLV